MNTLVIYDNTGKIYYQAAGDVAEPVGLNFLKVEIPEGKLLKSVNTAVTPHEPVFTDIMGIDLDTCTLEQLKAYQIAKSKEKLESYLSANPIRSACHRGTGKLYSITKEKQTLLGQEILMVQMAAQSGIDYQPSWNAQREPCTYDWVLSELQQLAFEIAVIVKPLVSHQQTIEAEINTAENKEAVLAIDITI